MTEYILEELFHPSSRGRGHYKLLWWHAVGYIFIRFASFFLYIVTRLFVMVNVVDTVLISYSYEKKPQTVNNKHFSNFIVIVPLNLVHIVMHDF